MAQLIIRNVDDDVKTHLQKQAAEHGWSMEEEAYQILRNALKEKGIAPVHPMAFLFAGGRADSLEPGVPAGVVVPFPPGAALSERGVESR